MIMDLNTMGLICDNPQVKGREYEEFMRKYRVLTTDELKAALRVDASDIFNVLNQSIPCVGCRRRYAHQCHQVIISLNEFGIDWPLLAMAEQGADTSQNSFLF